jgi:hypothetical protein
MKMRGDAKRSHERIACIWRSSLKLPRELFVPTSAEEAINATSTGHAHSLKCGYCHISKKNILDFRSAIRSGESSKTSV